MASFNKNDNNPGPPIITKSPECITPSAFDLSSRRSSAKVGIFNLISTMIGGGALSLPFAISRCGIILGFSLLILSAILSVFSFDILVSSSRRTGAMTYQQIGYFAFGKKVSLFVTVLILFNCYIASIAYCVLIGDLIKPVICYIFSINQTESLRRIIITISILCVSPFCFMREIRGLKYTSIISMTSVTILTIIITIHTIQHFNIAHNIYYIDNNGHSQSFLINSISQNMNLWPDKWADVIYVFPVFGISYCCHFNIPQVHSELIRPSRTRIRNVLLYVVISCFILYSIISFFGYFYALKYCCGNILLNYNQNDPIVTFGRLCLGLVLLFTYPLLILPERKSFHNLINAFSVISNSLTIKKIINLQQQNHNLPSPPSPASPDIQQNNSSLLYDPPQNNINGDKNINECVGESENVIDKNNYEKDVMELGDNFISHSISLTNSSLRVPADALGVINEPNDLLLLQEKEFMSPFKHLQSSKSYKPSKLCLIIETTVFITTSVIISFLTESVMVIWGLLGSTAAFLIAFIMPGIFYLKIRHKKGKTWRNILSFGIIILFSCAMVLCTWQAIKRLNAKPCPIQPGMD
eukprot:190092_1